MVHIKVLSGGEQSPPPLHSKGNILSKLQLDIQMLFIYNKVT